MKQFLISIILLFGAISLNAQDFFADEKGSDTIPKMFYENKFHGTVCYTIGNQNYWYGGSLLIHYNREKFSPYFEFRMNPSSPSTYTLIKRSNNGIQPTSDSGTTTLLFRTYNLSLGMAASPRRNVLLYGNIGLRYQQELFDKSQYVEYYIVDKDTKLNFIYGGGAMYIFPYGITAQLGFDFSKFTIITGLGFTF